MKIQNRFKRAIAGFRKEENSAPDPNAFLKYGHRKMPSTWSTPQITDEDFYTGYGYAVVNKRANRSVVLGKKFLYTDAKEEIIKKANEDGVRVTHPYLDLIRDSIDFAERDFWYDISTYLDLEGIYYLMAVRAVTEKGVVGNIQKFVLINPYHIRQVVNSKGELGGYIENDGNRQREIAKEMMIVIKLLNPFDNSRPYSLADAARDSQFTMKQANDFAREAINGNLNAPGILSSAIELPDDQFENFAERIKNHGRGEPLFGNGAGTVTWVDMQTDLDKAALDKINSINRDSLLAVSGLSKTGVGVEESGTGREVSRTQKDDFTENAIMPQIENIIDALNLDYRKYYKADYLKFKYSISLDNPLETDRDAEKIDVEIRDAQFTLQQALIAKGYASDIAAKFAKGLIDITDLGEPKNPPTDTPDTVDPVDPVDPVDKADPEDPVEPPAKPKNSSPEVYEGYAIPLNQYLGELAGQIDSHSEKYSILHLTEETDKIRIQHIEERGDSLIGVVDENSYVQLGDFHDTADRELILSTLNKRYNNQLVAVKHKGVRADLKKDFYDVLPSGLHSVVEHLVDTYQDRTWFESAFNDYREHVLASTPQTLQLPGVSFKKYLDISSDKASHLTLPEEIHTCEHHKVFNAPFDKQEQIDQGTSILLSSVRAAEDQMLRHYLDSISQGYLAPGADAASFASNLSLPFAVWFTVMFPVIAYQRAVETASALGISDVPVTAITAEVKEQINQFAQREAMSHMKTIKTDIDNALTIIRAVTSDPEEVKQMLRAAFVDIQKRRAALIASNATNRIFALSQYEADLQLLTRHDLTKLAYKQLLSRTGTPCPICASLIATTNQSPIPFVQAFASIGDSITAEGQTMNFTYEEVTAGNIHPNCNCYYKIIINKVEENAADVEKERLDQHTQIITETVRSEIVPLLDKLYADKNSSEEVMNKLADASARLDEKILQVESKLDQLDKRTKEARQVKEDLLEANQLKDKLSAAEEYAKQLESIIDGQS